MVIIVGKSEYYPIPRNTVYVMPMINNKTISDSIAIITVLVIVSVAEAKNQLCVILCEPIHNYLVKCLLG